MKYSLPDFRDKLMQSFSIDELKDLCFFLNVDDEIIEGTNKASKAKELVTFLDRRGRVMELVSKCAELRPAIDWNPVLSDQSQAEDFSRQIGLAASVRERVASLKFDTYMGVWQGLYPLKEAGDELWTSVSKENIANFGALLRRSRTLIGVNTILLDHDDLEAVESVLDRLGRFDTGKARLYEIRSEEDELHIYANRARHQIEANRNLKNEYEALLVRISTSFRSQVTRLAS